MSNFHRGARFTFPAKAATAVFLSVVFLHPCFAAFTLDPTFAGGGKLTIAFPDSSSNYTSQAFRIFVQPNNRILVGGTFTNMSPDGQLSGVAWAGLTPGGALDAGFGSGGLVTDWRSDASTSFRDALMYADGSTLRISQVLRLPVGSSTVQTVRLTANGSVDNVFASNVSVGPCCFGFFNARPVQVAVRSDGKILVLITDQGEHLLYRLNPDGTRDSTFGANGIVGITFNKFSPASIAEMIVLSDGKILLAGNIAPFNSPNGSSELFVARLGESGNWDKTFGRVGVRRFAFGAGTTGTVAKALVQPDGNILLAGSISNPDLDVWMMRLRPNARVDTSFGTGGIVVRDFLPGGADAAASAALSADGKVRLAGTLGSPQNVLVARFAANGTFEESTSIEFTPGQYAGANDVTLQPDGKVLVAGYTRHPNTAATTGSVFAVARLTE
ncbi:MAG: hypothetical protein ACK4S4_04220 [Pyrinomonadaceae bacterium]